MAILALQALGLLEVQVTSLNLLVSVMRDPADFLNWFYEALPPHQILKKHFDESPQVLVLMGHIIYSTTDSWIIDPLVNMVRPSYKTFADLASVFTQMYFGHAILQKCTIAGAMWFKTNGWPYRPEDNELHGRTELCIGEIAGHVSQALDRKDIKVSDEQLGKGATAIVVKGLWRGKSVAIKMLRRQPAARHLCFGINNDQQLFRFNLSDMEHTNVIKVHGVCYYPYCIVMEQLPYTATILKTRQLSRTQKLEFIKQVIRSVAHLHGREIAHGDIKLANFLISEDGILKIADLNNLVSTSPQGHIKFFGPVTRVYTATHVAPEVLLGEIYPWQMLKVDIFALGITILEVMQPRARLHIRSADSLALPRMYQSLFDDMEPVRLIVQQCLSDDPAERPDASQIEALLESLYPDNISVPIGQLLLHPLVDTYDGVCTCLCLRYLSSARPPP
eukprot:TRINITY_DN4640_c0_g1_i1.p1 TRINITY_DN4640_c0_g1~~TRINITY_DN4640_c0_g1_i1.p1  ORF type:complete len:501 (+),score=32.59 TRINITY_DN4640_c0_g1_i1:160-1503(+)